MPVTRREALIYGSAAVASTHIAALSSLTWAASSTPVVSTTNGKLAGTIDRGIAVFKGIRYGSDTRPRRFMPPLPAEPWNAVFEANEYGSASPQSRIDENTSEDCLFLNVWSPGVNDRATRPVMFYIHGGAYSSGSGSSSLYEGVNLCTRGDVVVVTVNHRLNAFGHLFLQRLAEPRFADSGNAGMLDLVLALQWVQKNIGVFGGDPSNVTVFGQSGGGAKIATMMSMPAAQGLFHRAATMSGQQLTASGPLNATRRAEVFLDSLGLSRANANKVADLPMEKLVSGLSAVDPIIGRGSVYFGPVLDERSLTRHPFYPDAPPQSKHIPMIIGNTHDETRNLIGRSDPSTFSLTWGDLPARLADHMRVDITPELVVAQYRKWYPQYTPTDVFFSATTASRSWRAAIVEAELRAEQGAPAFAYQLDWPSPLDGGKWGAPHTHDIALVFGTLDAKDSLTGTGAAAKKVSDQMSDAFIAFARTGDPNHTDMPKWKPYQLPQRQTMVFNETSALQNDPRGRERELFEKVPFIQQGT